MDDRTREMTIIDNGNGTKKYTTYSYPYVRGVRHRNKVETIINNSDGSNVSTIIGEPFLDPIPGKFYNDDGTYTLGHIFYYHNNDEFVLKSTVRDSVTNDLVESLPDFPYVYNGGKLRERVRGLIFTNSDGTVAYGRSSIVHYEDGSHSETIVTASSSGGSGETGAHLAFTYYYNSEGDLEMELCQGEYVNNTEFYPRVSLRDPTPDLGIRQLVAPESVVTTLELRDINGVVSTRLMVVSIYPDTLSYTYYTRWTNLGSFDDPSTTMGPSNGELDPSEFPNLNFTRSLQEREINGASRTRIVTVIRDSFDEIVGDNIETEYFTRSLTEVIALPFVVDGSNPPEGSAPVVIYNQDGTWTKISLEVHDNRSCGRYVTEIIGYPTKEQKYGQGDTLFSVTEGATQRSSYMGIKSFKEQTDEEKAQAKTAIDSRVTAQTIAASQNDPITSVTTTRIRMLESEYSSLESTVNEYSSGLKTTTNTGWNPLTTVIEGGVTTTRSLDFQGSGPNEESRIVTNVDGVVNNGEWFLRSKILVILATNTPFGSGGTPYTSSLGIDSVQNPAHYLDSDRWGVISSTTSTQEVVGEDTFMVVDVLNKTKGVSNPPSSAYFSSSFKFKYKYVEGNNPDYELYEYSGGTSIDGPTFTYSGSQPDKWPVIDMRMTIGDYKTEKTFQVYINPVDDHPYHPNETDQRNVIFTEASTSGVVTKKVTYDTPTKKFGRGLTIDDIDKSTWVIKERSFVISGTTVGCEKIEIVTLNRHVGLPAIIEYLFTYNSSSVPTVTFKCNGLVNVGDGTTVFNEDYMSACGKFQLITSEHIAYPKYVNSRPDYGQNGNYTTTLSYSQSEYDINSTTLSIIDENGDGNSNYQVYNQGTIRSVTVITVEKPCGSLQINISYGITEQNYEDFQSDHTDINSIVYLQQLVDNVSSTVHYSIYDLEAINNAINIQGNQVVDQTIEMKENESIAQFRALNDSYAGMITIYQKMTSDIGAKIVISDKELREAWMVEFERFTTNIRFMRSLVLDLTAVYKLENRLSVSFWNKLSSVVATATGKVSDDIDVLLNHGNESCNPQVVNRIIDQIGKLQASFKGLSDLKTGGTHTLENVMNLIPDGLQVSEVTEIVSRDEEITKNVSSLNTKLQRLKCIMSAKASFDGVQQNSSSL